MLQTNIKGKLSKALLSCIMLGSIVGCSDNQISESSNISSDNSVSEEVSTNSSEEIFSDSSNDETNIYPDAKVKEIKIRIYDVYNETLSDEDSLHVNVGYRIATSIYFEEDVDGIFELEYDEDKFSFDVNLKRELFGGSYFQIASHVIPRRRGQQTLNVKVNGRVKKTITLDIIDNSIEATFIDTFKNSYIKDDEEIVRYETYDDFFNNVTNLGFAGNSLFRYKFNRQDFDEYFLVAYLSLESNYQVCYLENQQLYINNMIDSQKEPSMYSRQLTFVKINKKYVDLPIEINYSYFSSMIY